ncbi:hypothetical protein V8C35DRAFT_315060 [Trichoderma chlorosporum]
MESTTTPMQWEILTRGDPHTTFESLYKITETAKIVEKLEFLVNSIDLQGIRSKEVWEKAKEIDEKHKAELLPVLEKIKLLCSPGSEWGEPIPEQHVLRKEMPIVEGKRVLHIRDTEQSWRFKFFPEAVVNGIIGTLDGGVSADFKKFVEHDVCSNFYFLLPDLLGLFLSKLGTAPPLATAKNFFIPILALYARWTGVLLGGNSTALSKEQIEDFEADPDFPKAKVVVQDDMNNSTQPNMYQITWTEPEAASGEPHLFSLGASIGGYYVNLGKRKFGGLLRRARWGVCDRDKKLASIVETYVWPVPKQKTQKIKTMKWMWAPNGGSIEPYRFGNCGETYTFLHMLSNRTAEEKKRTMGIALSARGTTLDPKFDKKTENFKIEEEYNYDYITKPRDGTSSLDFLTEPCGNCAQMVRFYDAELDQFKPPHHFK